MRGLPLIAAASALCLASAAQARMPVFLEIDGVKGETTKSRGSARSNAQGGSTMGSGRQISSEQAQPYRQAVLTTRKCGDCDSLHAGAEPASAAENPPPPARRMAKSSRTVIRIDHHQPEATRSGVNVAVGDVTGDGHTEAALLLPAVQKVRATDNGENPGTATSTQGPYKLNRAPQGQAAPAKPKPKPKPKPSDLDDDTPPSETISLN